MSRRRGPGSARTPRHGVLRTRRVSSPPAQGSRAGGSSRRSTARPSATWRGGMRPRTTARRCRPRARAAARRMSLSGVCAPSEMQRAFGHEHRLDHQQAEPVLLAGKVVSSTRGAPGVPRESVDRRAQRDLQLLGVQVLLEDLQLAAHPGVADRSVQRRDVSRTKRCRPCRISSLASACCSAGASCGVEHRQDAALERRRGLVAARAARARRPCALSSGERSGMILPGRRPTSIRRFIARSLPTSAERVGAFAVVVARGLGKP